MAQVSPLMLRTQTVSETRFWSTRWNGRRSIYIEMRHSFPHFEGFRYAQRDGVHRPTPSNQRSSPVIGIDERSFVHEQARAWQNEYSIRTQSEQRIQEIHQTAFSRPASDTEMNGPSDFLLLADEYGSSLDDLAAGPICVTLSTTARNSYMCFSLPTHAFSC